jgi:hypothetical protein
MHWNINDWLSVQGHASEKGEGLSYKSQILQAMDNGASNGWDVYEGLNEKGEEVSFYGFSVVDISPDDFNPFCAED